MKLFFFVTEDWYFCSHRLPLALAARDAGYDVTVVTRVRDHGEVIRRAGLALISLESSRRSVNPLSELMVVLRLAAIYRREKPDIVHHVAVKPVVYGSIAAWACGVTSVVNALAGLGWLFSSDSNLARTMRPIVRMAFRMILKRGAVIVQNADDAGAMRSLGIMRVHHIQGSGVNEKSFVPGKEPDGVPVIVLVARLLREKGVPEFAEAARILRKEQTLARFVVVGAPDPGNRSSVPESQIRSWVADGDIEWWGQCGDMPEIYRRAHIACLPTFYGEGIPKALLEAASCGLPIVTTDMAGCREVVADGKNGILVPPRDPIALAGALRKLINDKELRRSMGRAGRGLVLQKFTEAHVVEATLPIYESVLSDDLGTSWRVVTRRVASRR